MSRKSLVIILTLVFLALAQISFAPHFIVGWWFAWFNLIDVPVLVVALLEKRKNNLGWAAAFLGGIILDMYSAHFGMWLAIMVGSVAFIKFILKKYVSIPSFW
ncbi:MAG: hypothetical protein MUD10_01160 [Candidatus Pacebacteria bacterium]|nr:hypothetical protein [Candidatus Paceibacterota bacterium]